MGFNPDAFDQGAFDPSAFDFGTGDNVPTPFSFATQTNVPRETLLESEAVVIGGINEPADVTITGGEYSIDGGAYTSAPGTIENGQSVRVRHTSSADFFTATHTVLTIGGVSGTFTSTTLRERTGGDDAPPPHRGWNRTLSLKKRRAARAFEQSIAELYKQLHGAPGVAERVEQIVAPLAAPVQAKGESEEERQAAVAARAQRIAERIRELDAEGRAAETALRMLRQELQEAEDREDEEAIRLLLAGVL